jgi:hypothetical protein
MLLDEKNLRVEGEQGAVLFEVYTTVAQLLEELGHPHEQADQLALRMLPRLHNRLSIAGMVVRQVQTSIGRHAETS